ncbi:type II toxin-antitoxin system RelE/ParE family toxin [Mycolicibacter algericus]|uniref:type II toxin-antitoxin system RelE/ParE family toxin n=1 Tax=Mycolicibacter algericus TaxID=1288388 RepID=UPI003C76EA4F
MSLGVVFTPEAQGQLVELHRYIAAAASAEVAERYTEAIVAFCEELAPPESGQSPRRRQAGTAHDRLQTLSRHRTGCARMPLRQPFSNDPLWLQGRLRRGR